MAGAYSAAQLVDWRRNAAPVSVGRIALSTWSTTMDQPNAPWLRLQGLSHAKLSPTACRRSAGQSQTLRSTFSTRTCNRFRCTSAGEIYVGGAGVARGYLNRPELTAEKFVRNPFSRRSADARLYRTGDLARYLANGEIAYLGRIDEQIKILGHRIEPNEIVAVLDRHPSDSGQPRNRARKILAARNIWWLTSCPESETQPSAADLRSFLEKELPHYMVPAVFVRLESFPLDAKRQSGSRRPAGARRRKTRCGMKSLPRRARRWRNGWP